MQREGELMGVLPVWMRNDDIHENRPTTSSWDVLNGSRAAQASISCRDHTQTAHPAQTQ
jgi:hypothetical protein